MAQDWYPDALAARIPWHANFAAQAVASGMARGLTATQAARAALDSAPLALAVGTLPGIEARTRQHAGVPEAYPARAATVGEACGVAPAGPKGPTVPDLKAAPLTQSRVSLRVWKGGWGRIGVATTTTCLDARPPLVPGAPEVREYRAQGMEDNLRVGAFSEIVSAVTTP